MSLNETIAVIAALDLFVCLAVALVMSIPFSIDRSGRSVTAGKPELGDAYEDELPRAA